MEVLWEPSAQDSGQDSRNLARASGELTSGRASSLERVSRVLLTRIPHCYWRGGAGGGKAADSASVRVPPSPAGGVPGAKCRRACRVL